jgi:uncharacterized protein with NAD-binding domain and iron-sulfur cluster
MGGGYTRRELLHRASAVGAAAAVTRQLPAAAAHRRRPRTVAILGGGVAGLSAAQELAERGFRVNVYERRAYGGKARSVGVPGTARGGRMQLPGEHGMRFFPGFYQNLPDTMRRIPFGSNPAGVFGNLRDASQGCFARSGGRHDLIVQWKLEPAPTTPAQLGSTLFAWLETATKLPANELAYFVQRMQVFFSSCEARRLGQWEKESWWDFVAGDRFSEDYQRLLVNSVTRQILAADARVASARTLGILWEAFVYNLTGRTGTGSFDRVLDAPTNEAWIAPWLTHLRGLGVRFHLPAEIEGLEVRGGRVVAARVTRPRGRSTIRADYFVAAAPVERARRWWSPAVLALDPRLGDMRNLQTRWMNGIQFYLREPIPVIRGHVLYVDSPWALSSISQSQFWARDFHLAYGNGSAADCFSVDIGDFTVPGLVYGKPARELRPAEIAHETWEQMKAHLNDTGSPVLRDELLLSWYLDPGLIFRTRRKDHHRSHRRRRVANEDPLMISTPGSWADRPGAATAIPNLFLAADYVQVGVDTSCMEGANEAARRATGALLAEAGSAEPLPRVYKQYRPPEYRPLQDADEQRFKHGQPNLLDTPPPLAIGESL